MTDKTLETGWGPGAPPGDTVANDFVQESAASFAGFARARGDRCARTEGVVTMCDAGSPLPFHNRAIAEQPIGDVEPFLGSLRDFYGTTGAGPVLLDSTWPTPDLRPHNFALMGHPPLMVRAPELDLPPAPPELRIVRVDDERTAFDFEHTLAYGYPAPPLQPVEKVTVLTPGALTAPGWHHFVGYVADEPVAAGSTFLGERQLRVDNIATLAEVRGRGYGRAITAATIAVDRSKPATLIASDLGRPIYESLGFVAIMRVTYWVGLRQPESSRR